MAEIIGNFQLAPTDGTNETTDITYFYATGNFTVRTIMERAALLHLSNGYCETEKPVATDAELDN